VCGTSVPGTFLVHHTGINEMFETLGDSVPFQISWLLESSYTNLSMHIVPLRHSTHTVVGQLLHKAPRMRKVVKLRINKKHF
jgi:hypothetical protein